MSSVDSPPPGLAEIAGRIVGEVVASPPVDVVHIPRGAMTWKFDVTLGSGERFIVRFYPPGREEVVDYEPDLLQRCVSAGLAVPSVVTDARSGPRAPRPYVVYRRIEGSTLADRWEQLDTPTRELAARQLVDALERLHTVPIEGWGELTTGWQARETSWDRFVRRALDEGLTAASGSGALTADLLAIVHFIRTRLDGIAPPRCGGLVWADVSPDNVLVDRDGSLAGLLDFESCIGGELCANLGYCSASSLGTGFFEAIRDAWGEPTGAEAVRAELYAVVRAMLIAKFAAKGPMPGGLPRRSVEEFLPGLRPAAESLRRRLEACR